MCEEFTLGKVVWHGSIANNTSKKTPLLLSSNTNSNTNKNATANLNTNNSNNSNTSSSQTLLFDIKGDEFPLCLQSMDIMLKLCAMTWHNRPKDLPLAWTIYAWVYRLLFIVFLGIMCMPYIFVGSNTLMIYYVKNTSSLLIRISMIGSTLMISLSSIYPLYFCTIYVNIENNLHLLLRNLLLLSSSSSTSLTCTKNNNQYINVQLQKNGVDSHTNIKKLEDIFANDIRNTCVHCRYFVASVCVFQYIGWIIVTYVETAHKPYFSYFGNFCWPLMWVIFRWLPIATAISILYIVMKILLIYRNLLMAQIAQTQKTNANANANACQKHMQPMRFLSHPHFIRSIDTSNVSPIRNMQVLCSTYLNLLNTFEYHSRKWKYFMIILMVSLALCSFASLVVLYFVHETVTLGTVVMLPAFYIFIAFVLLFKLAELNETSKEILKLISVTHFGFVDEDIHIPRLLAMIHYHPCEFKVSGMVFDKNRVNGAALAISTLGITAVAKYLFPSLD